ncbi:unnamed protein product [Coccothraustes coccothraustes]
MFYDPECFFLNGTGAASCPCEAPARAVLMWQLLRVPVPSPGPASALSGAAGGGLAWDTVALEFLGLPVSPPPHKPSFEGPSFTARAGAFLPFHLCCLSQRKPIAFFFNCLKVLRNHRRLRPKGKVQRL